MEAALKVIVAAAGFFLLGMTFIIYAKKKLTEAVSLVWAIASVVIILLGMVPGLSGWSSAVVQAGCQALVLIMLVLVLGAFWLSVELSQLVMRSRELAMHVSLLNQENERILMELRKILGERK